MKMKHKITLLVIGILLALSLMLSSSYALWVFNVSQESTNVLVSDCFEITLSDNKQRKIEIYDILQLVNEFNLAGAEAISINDERIIGTTDIKEVNSNE